MNKDQKINKKLDNPIENRQEIWIGTSPPPQKYQNGQQTYGKEFKLISTQENAK